MSTRLLSRRSALIVFAMLMAYLLCHVAPGATEHAGHEPGAHAATASVGCHPAPDAPAPLHDSDHPRCVAMPRSDEHADGAELAGPLLPGGLPSAAFTARPRPRARRDRCVPARCGRDVLTRLCVLRR